MTDLDPLQTLANEPATLLYYVFAGDGVEDASVENGVHLVRSGDGICGSGAPRSDQVGLQTCDRLLKRGFASTGLLSTLSGG